jgi:peptidoglycan hydrolase CwlO-like protein
LQRQVRELQSHITQNEDEIKGLHGNMRELRQVVRELIKRIPEDNDGMLPTTREIRSRTIAGEDTQVTKKTKSHTLQG